MWLLSNFFKQLVVFRIKPRCEKTRELLPWNLHVLNSLLYRIIGIKTEKGWFQSIYLSTRIEDDMDGSGKAETRLHLLTYFTCCDIVLEALTTASLKTMDLAMCIKDSIMAWLVSDKHTWWQNKKIRKYEGAALTGD